MPCLPSPQLGGPAGSLGLKPSPVPGLFGSASDLRALSSSSSLPPPSARGPGLWCSPGMSWTDVPAAKVSSGRQGRQTAPAEGPRAARAGTKVRSAAHSAAGDVVPEGRGDTASPTQGCHRAGWAAGPAEEEEEEDALLGLSSRLTCLCLVPPFVPGVAGAPSQHRWLARGSPAEERELGRGLALTAGLLAV